MSNNSLPLVSSELASNVVPSMQHEERAEEGVLPARKDFFGHEVALHTAAEHSNIALQHLEEAKELLKQHSASGFQEQPALLERIIFLKEQAALQTGLAQEALQKVEENQSSSLGPIAAQLATIRQEVGIEARTVSAFVPVVVEEERRRLEQTCLPEQLPPSFVSGREDSNSRAAIEREQRRLLRSMAAHEEKAAYYERQIKRQEKLLGTVKEHGSPERIKKQEDYIVFLQEEAVGHTLVAHEIGMQIHGNELTSPGAYNVVTQGNYQWELPVISPAPAVQAREIKKTDADLRRLPRGKVETPLQGQVLPLLPQQGTHQRDPSIKARKVEVKKAEAVSPKNLKFPEAQIQWRN
ncbi:MAG: hypothetical protein K2W99_06790 [Chthoniobacterales bacterium]|nr:hypothetical protein [Chthoniobacterales bacterium]